MSVERADMKDQIKELIGSQLHDLEETTKGQMVFYSLSKNLRIQLFNRLKINKTEFSKFEEQAVTLKADVALFISSNELIPYTMKTILSPSTSRPLLLIYVHKSDLTKRFINMLANLPNISSNEIKFLQLEQIKKPPVRPAQASDIDRYQRTSEGFSQYCQNTFKTRLEFAKAKSKWPELMEPYTTKEQFITYCESLKPVKNNETPTATLEEFYEYVKETSPSNMTKQYIREHFGNLDDSITNLNETKEFRNKMKDLRKRLLDD